MTGMFGGGVIFVVAALLWAAVLVPSWVRRREFKAAERNAVRLQRTLRVLAETAEVPTEVRVEATAREALAHERLLRTAQRQQEAERQAELARARAEQVRAEMRAQQMRRRHAALTRAARLRRPAVRRLRALAALCAVLAIAGVLVGLGFLAAGQGMTVLAISSLAVLASAGGLVLMAPGRVRAAEIPAERVEPTVARAVDAAPESAEPFAPSDETAAAHAAAQTAAAARIERARALARARAARPAAPELRNRPESMLLEQAPRKAAEAGTREAPRVETPAAASVARSSAARPSAAPTSPAAPERPASAAERRPSQADRLRQMGVIGDTSDGMLDLDAALRTRRSAS